MRTDRTTAGSIDEYIAGFPRAVQTVLARVRSTIRKAVPDAEEVISYKIERIAKFRAKEAVERGNARAVPRKKT